MQEAARILFLLALFVRNMWLRGMKMLLKIITVMVRLHSVENPVVVPFGRLVGCETTAMFGVL